MSVVNLYNGVYKVLANDNTVLNYLGIGASASNLEKAKHIQKRAKPQNLAESLPLIAFYALPGKREGQNLLVYTTNFVFDIYTNDDVNLAQQIADRISSLFDGEIHPMMGIESYESLVVTMHESESDLANTYCFTVVIQFSMTLEQF
jgi:hypothetical protein